MGRIAMNRFSSISLLFLCTLLLGFGPGCARHEPTPVAAPAPVAPPAPATAPQIQAPLAERTTAYLDQGVRAFDAGETKKAVAAWREAVTRETDPAVRQRALFALAAVKLAQAGSEAELNAAMELFENWLKNAPPGGSGEDPRFLAPVVRAFRPAFAIKEMNVAREKQCARKLADREEQVRRMQQQIKALENIHREIQEKKKGLTNY